LDGDHLCEKCRSLDSLRSLGMTAKCRSLDVARDDQRG